MIYNTHYSYKQIRNKVNEIKSCIKSQNFTLALNSKRTENQDFIKEYNLSTKQVKRILLSLKTEDFCYTLQNIKKGYEHEKLYVFVPQIKLYNRQGKIEIVDIYLKFNIIEGKKVIVISFHHKNKPVKYLFKKAH